MQGRGEGLGAVFETACGNERVRDVGPADWPIFRSVDEHVCVGYREVFFEAPHHGLGAGLPGGNGVLARVCQGLIGGVVQVGKQVYADGPA